ncbi:MAG: F0F1 ATP synthase subunit delta [Pseudomonadota bacterium]
MIDTALAKRYARALVDIGQEKDALEQYGRDLSSIRELMEISGDFREILVNPVFPKEEKKRVSSEIMGKMGLDPMVSNFVHVLIDRKRIGLLTSIERAYMAEVDEIRGITRGEVTSAVPLGDEELTRITDSLSIQSGKQVIVTTKVEPSLIGGIVAKVGDMVFDGTIRTQLNQLKESLKG